MTLALQGGHLDLTTLTECTCAPRLARAVPAAAARLSRSGAEFPPHLPYLSIDRRAHAGKGVSRGMIVGEAVPGWGGAAAARGRCLVVGVEARKHHSRRELSASWARGPRPEERWGRAGSERGHCSFAAPRPPALSPILSCSLQMRLEYETPQPPLL